MGCLLWVFWRKLTRCPSWISNYIHYNVWDEIIYPFPNFNGAANEVWKPISDFIPHFTDHVITYPCWDLSYSILENSNPGYNKASLYNFPWQQWNMVHALKQTLLRSLLLWLQTEMEMLSFQWKAVTKISSKWRHLRFTAVVNLMHL